MQDARVGGTLYVVATPIGNLEDITLRALKILKTVQLVAAEDTRRTGNLLRHFNIDDPDHQRTRAQRAGASAEIIGRLAKGDSVALVTDAGTPGVSDPGGRIGGRHPVGGIRDRADSGSECGCGRDFCRLESAVTALPSWDSRQLGLKTAKFGSRALVEAAKSRAVVFFEAPHKLRRTLEELIILVNRPIFVGRELTKLHEELVLGHSVRTSDEIRQSAWRVHAGHSARESGR